MKIHPIRVSVVALLFSLAAVLSVSPRRGYADMDLKVTDKTKTTGTDKNGKSKGTDEQEEETKASCA